MSTGGDTIGLGVSGGVGVDADAGVVAVGGAERVAIDTVATGVGWCGGLRSA